MILYEDKEMIVCHKRAGMPVQSASVRQKDMVSVLRNHLGGGDVYVVHRLDQPVEGVVVFAKTKAAAADLSRQIANGSMRKVYQAVVELPEDARIADFRKRADDQNLLFLNEWYPLVDYLVKDGRMNRSFVSEAGRPGAKRAELRYRILKWWAKTQPKCREEQPTKLQPKCQEEQPTKLQPKCREGQPVEAQMECYKEHLTRENMRFCEENPAEGQMTRESGDKKTDAESESRLALVEIELMTGRHHQIRVQMAHAGLPLAGDRKYNPRYAEDAGNLRISNAENGRNPGSRNAEKPESTRNTGNPGNAENPESLQNGYGDVLALCAVSLTFRHPSTKKRVTYEVEPCFTLDGRS